MTPPSVDEYLSALPDAQRAALEQLRAQIRAAAPDAIEAIGYGRPAFRVNGRYFAGFGVAGRQCSLYIGRAPLQAYATELAGYRLWKGTINFPPDRPLPAMLVTKLVKARIAEQNGEI